MTARLHVCQLRPRPVVSRRGCADRIRQHSRLYRRRRRRRRCGCPPLRRARRCSRHTIQPTSTTGSSTIKAPSTRARLMMSCIRSGSPNSSCAMPVRIRGVLPATRWSWYEPWWGGPMTLRLQDGHLCARPPWAAGAGRAARDAPQPDLRSDRPAQPEDQNVRLITTENLPRPMFLPKAFM